MIRWFQTGAAVSGGVQYDPALSLGLYRSDVEAGLGVLRRGVTLPGIYIEFAAPGNGTGTGTLRAVDGTGLVWTPPVGGTGEMVRIDPYTTAVVSGSDPDAYLRVRRDGASTLAGFESVDLAELYGGPVAGGDVDADAGVVTFRALMGFADGAVADLAVWIDEGDGVRIAWETPTSGALSDCTADEETGPSGLTWNTGDTAGTGLTLSSMADGDEVGLWIERTVAAESGASPRERISLAWQCSSGGETRTGRLSGLWRQYDDALPGLLLWHGVGAAPDLGDAPDYTFAVGTTQAVTLAEGSNYLVLRKRNRYGLISQNVEPTVVWADALGVPEMAPPSAPVSVDAASAPDGAVRITALYMPFADGTARATGWAVWVWRADEAEPETATHTADMTTDESPQVLEWTADCDYLDGAEVMVRVVATRGAAVSEAVETSVMVDRLGPVRPLGTAFYSMVSAQAQSTVAAPAGEMVIHVARDLRIEYGANSSALYLGSALAWRIYGGRCYVPSDWTINLATTVTGAGSGEDPVEAASDTEAYVLVRGQRRLKIDWAAKRITCAGRSEVQTPVEVGPPAPAWARYLETAFLSWDARIEAWRVAFDVDGDGVIRTRVTWNTALTQTEIEAL